MLNNLDFAYLHCSPRPFGYPIVGKILSHTSIARHASPVEVQIRCCRAAFDVALLAAAWGRQEAPRTKLFVPRVITEEDIYSTFARFAVACRYVRRLGLGHQSIFHKCCRTTSHTSQLVCWCHLDRKQTGGMGLVCPHSLHDLQIASCFSDYSHFVVCHLADFHQRLS